MRSEILRWNTGVGAYIPSWDHCYLFLKQRLDHVIGSDLLSESNKLYKHSDLDATRRLEELQSEFAEAPPSFISCSLCCLEYFPTSDISYPRYS